jgi:hypothetical protein
MNSVISCLLLVLLAATTCSAFSPVATSRASTSLNNFLDGSPIDPKTNAYSRGGKNSWEFETESMFIEEPKQAKVALKKKIVAKKSVTKKATPVKKVSLFGAKKTVAAKKETVKPSNPFSFLGAKKAVPVKKEVVKPSNPFAGLFKK